MRTILIALLVMIFILPVSAEAFELKITRPERAGPTMLVCLTPNGLIEHVNRLTRNQLIGITAAARNRQIRHPCDDVQLPVGTQFTGHSRWVQTQDGWWILGRTVVYPNQVTMFIADPGTASYRQKPPEFRLRFVVTPDGRIYERVD